MLEEIIKTQRAIEILGIEKRFNKIESFYKPTIPDLSGFLTTETDPIVGAITGIVKADGAGNISAAFDGTDYLSPATGLKLDQTTPQEIINGAPIFTQGLIIKAGERIYFDG